MTDRSTRNAAITFWQNEESAALTAIAAQETYLRYVRERLTTLRSEP